MQTVKLIFFAPRVRKYKGEQEQEHCKSSLQPDYFSGSYNKTTAQDEINFYALQSASWAFTLLG